MGTIQEETRRPVILWLITFSGISYIIIGLITFFIDPNYKITHLPAWFRRIIDGIFITILAFVAWEKRESIPWSGWFDHSWVIWYSLISLIVHYGGMLPPIYIYDTYPFFNRIMHANASLILVLLSYYGRDNTEISILDGVIAFIIGLLWEVLEFLTIPNDVDYWSVIDIGYGWYDTKLDLIFNTIGILIGYLITYSSHKNV